MSVLATHLISKILLVWNDLPNTIIMVAEPLAPPAASIQQVHAAQVVGSLAHVFSKAAVEEFCKNQWITVEINTFLSTLCLI
jgi:hypothetical protein